MTIGERLRELRLKKGWSQYDLVANCGVSLATIGHMESGRGYGRESTHLMLAKALGISLGEFLRGVEKPSKKEG